MDNVLLKFKRLSDKRDFYIGNGTLWRLLKGGLEGFSDVDNIVNYSNNATSDGGYIDSTYVPVKDRNVSCAYVMPVDNLKAREAAIKFFSVKKEYRVFITYNNRTLWADCVLVRFALNISTRYKDRLDLSLALRFTNPYWNDSTPDVNELNKAHPLIAFPYLCANDPTYPGPQGITGGIIINEESTTEVNNNGTVPTYPKVTIKFGGHCVNPYVTINGHIVRVLDTIDFGDIIVMDFAAIPPTVRKNNVNWVGHCDRDSEFESMYFNVGLNEFTYGAEDGSASMRVILEYNNRYEVI